MPSPRDGDPAVNTERPLSPKRGGETSRECRWIASANSESPPAPPDARKATPGVSADKLAIMAGSPA